MTCLFFCYNKNAGWAQPCTLSNVSISQSKTGQIISGKPEFEVTISNNCICTQTNVKVQCTGFSSVEQVDPAVFSKTDDQYCLVNMPITQSSTVSFKYASDVMYNLTPVDSNVSCSWDGTKSLLVLSSKEWFKLIKACWQKIVTNLQYLTVIWSFKGFSFLCHFLFLENFTNF